MGWCIVEPAHAARLAEPLLSAWGPSKFVRLISQADTMLQPSIRDFLDRPTQRSADESE